MSSGHSANDLYEISNYLLQDAVYASDEFRMFGFKINKCPKTRSHDWTLCPFAHRGEKACRRDPRYHNYDAVACPHFRLSSECPQGQLCPHAHGVFEYWLHPAKYRTRVCNAGKFCTRIVCFFAHSSDELRPEPEPESEPEPEVPELSNFLQFQSCMYGIGKQTGGNNEAAAAAATEEAVELDFLASLSGLKLAEAEDMPWNVIKKMIAVDGSKDPA
ncbi:zinc finger CCCH domain-containing protein 54-like [Impatiens glandulifera]|uniref:zinc finger CCCH domain-containing protein 54-like n=1 Tax=Impatiens glandulifera TaxID=253017 RepID=UPI001FB0A3C1|nr:zinc finger CCCH domain-containing protein 54-like [Impatiens glandulifera]